MQVQYNGQYDRLPFCRRGFDSPHLLHVTVAQLVERLIVAQNVGGSSPLSHPIDRHSKFTFYKNAYFGFKNCYCNFCLVLCPSSSVGQSMGFLILGSGVRIPPGVPIFMSAQLSWTRAPGYEPGGREFESLSGCHSNKGFVDYLEMYQVMTGKILPGPGKHFYLIFLKKYDIIYM